MKRIIANRSLRIEKRILLFFSLLTLAFSSQTIDVPGYYLKTNGDTVKCIFKVPLAGGEPRYVEIQKGIKIWSVDSYLILKPDTCLKLVLFYDTNNIEMLSLPDKYSLAGKNKNVFLRPKYFGIISIYHYQFYESPFYQIGGGLRRKARIRNGYILEHIDGRFLKTTYGGAKNTDLANFFYDHKELANEILSKEFWASNELLDQRIQKYTEWYEITNKEISIEQPSDSIEIVSQDYQEDTTSRIIFQTENHLVDSQKILKPDYLISKYGDVYYQDQQFNSEQVIELYDGYPELQESYLYGKKLIRISKPLLIAGIIGGSVGNVTIGTEPLIGGIAYMVFVPVVSLAIVLKFIGGNKVSDSVNRYNLNTLEQSGKFDVHYNLGLTPSGVGLLVSF